MVGAGAKHLLVPTVPNLGLVPEVQALLGVFPQAKAVASALSQAFNSMVDAQLASITADITRLDTYKFLTDLVADPESFGLPASTNVTDPCFTGFVGVPSPDPVCPNPEAYVFFDKIHPSAATHEVLGRLASNAVPVPLTAALLGLGLGIFGYQRRRVSA
jgi:outer membrane lipase/esterase